MYLDCRCSICERMLNLPASVPILAGVGSETMDILFNSIYRNTGYTTETAAITWYNLPVAIVVE